MEDKKIKILYMVNSSEIGGAEKSLLFLIDVFKNRNFEIYVLCLRGEGNFTEELRKRDVTLYVYNLKKDLFSILKVYKNIKEINPDILQTFLFISNILGRILGKIARVRVIISSQRSVDRWRKWYHWIIDKITSKFSTVIISNSYSAKEILIKKAKIKPEKIIVIPNGIKIPEKISGKKYFDFKKDDFVVGTVGNLRKVKDHETFIKAAGIVSEKYPYVKFLIAGKGPLENYLVGLTKKLGISEKFVFTGFVKEIEKVYTSIDIFVLTSLWEGCPLSVLEAMSFGIPVVSFSVGDVPFIIDNEKNGIIIQDRNYKKVAEKIIFLIENEEERKKIGSRGREKVKEEFSLDKMIEQYSKVYHYLLKRGHRKGKIIA